MAKLLSEISTPDYHIFFIENTEAIVNFIATRNYSKTFILVDNNTKKYCLPFLPKIEAYIIEVSEGENHKNLSTCEFIWNEMLHNHADRNSLLVNLGGGVISDMGAFCAALYKRGIDFINVPTTLLAMVDATVGGKTGIDFHRHKNMIGTFSHPNAIFIYPEFLKTLHKNHFRSGLAEMFKHSLLDNSIDAKNIFKLDKENPQLPELIAQSIQTKKKVVDSDPKEKGYRKVLNFGHTIGHALESCFLNTEKPLLHGEAVAWGIIAELWLSSLKLNFPKETMNQLISEIQSAFPEKINLLPHVDEIVNFTRFDKKNASGNVRFVLLKNIGEPVYDIEVAENEIIQSVLLLHEIINS
jgi:3-dehydroquinate synthase